MDLLKHNLNTLPNGYIHTEEYWVNELKYVTFILHKISHSNRIDIYEEKIFPHQFDKVTEYNNLVTELLQKGQKIVLQKKQAREFKEKQLTLF